MAFWDIFSSSSKAVETAATVIDKTTTGVISGVDKMFYTDEEKAEAKAKWFTTWLELQKTLANEGTPTAVGRRILAFMIMGVFLFFLVLAIFAWPFYPAWAKFIFDNGVDKLEVLAGAVGATYFMKDLVVKGVKAYKK